MAYYDLMMLARRVRWLQRRRQATKQWGKDVMAAQPALVVNAIPKSGSHLLTQVVDGLFAISPLVDTGMPPVNRSSGNVKYATDDEVQARIRQLQAGDFAYAYLNANEHYLPLLSEDPYAVLFIYRDPRDVVVSQVKYATQVNERHHMRAYYQTLDSEEDCINAAIRGVDDEVYKISSILKRYENYLGWLDCSTALPVKFEDLILDREVAFEKILTFLKGHGLVLNVSDGEAVAAMHEAVQPEKSGTFRKGKPGGWKETFTVENKDVFKEVTGDLLMRLGYEESMEW